LKSAESICRVSLASLVYSFIRYETFDLFLRLIGQFERIAEQAVRTPMSTAELMEIIAFLSKSKTQTIPDLEKRLVQAKDELLFLLDNTDLPPADLRLNTNMFSWIERMPAAFDEHATIVKEKTEQFKEALTVKYIEIIYSYVFKSMNF
jgi:dynein heavy chain